MKRTLAAVIAGISLATAACSGGATSPSPASQAPTASAAESPVASSVGPTAECAGGQQAKVTFWHTYNTDGPENKQLLDVVIPAFQKKCPNITIDPVVMPYDGLFDQLVTAVSGGGLPDIMRMDIIWTPQFAKVGALVPVDDLPGFNDIKDQVFPGPLATNVYQGKHYGVPLDTNTQVLIYNKDLVPEAPRTLDDVRKAAEAVKGQKDKWGLALGGAGPWNVLPWFWTAGGNVTDDNFTKASGILNSDASVAALQWLVDMQNDGLLGPSTLGGKPDSWGGFKGVNYGMLSDGPWFFPIIAKDMGPQVQGVPMPTGPGGSISVIGGENLVIFKSSKQAEAAWAFAQYLLSDEAQIAMAETGQMPVTRSASQSQVMKDVPYFAPYVTQLETAKPRTVSADWPKIEKILTNAFEAALRGTSPVKEALDGAAAQIDPLLAP
ncbi:MAG: ABC transporter substrate-binding protein [Anaerolinea sp.]|nr:ABC transporter substrate-binding protein [Anaerolinea sp.]